jgi:hypothetical protein
VQHVCGDAVLLQHHAMARSVEGRVAPAAALGVGRERLLELVGEAQVVDHQAAWLVAEHTVHAGDRLHEAVALHRLVGVHRVQARRVEAGQPHVAHDDDPERVLAVLESVGQRAALGLVADVRLPLGAVVGAAGHDHLDHAGLLALGLCVVAGGAGPVGRSSISAA